MNILDAFSKIGLIVAALLLLASGILSVIGKETMADRFGLTGCGILIVGIVLLLVVSIKRSSKGVNKGKG